jgi:hypothetical protein
MSHQSIIRKPGEGRTIAVVGDVYRFLATGEDRNGKYAMWEAIVPPGGGQPVEPGAAIAPLPTKVDIEKLLTVAPRYGVEIRVPHH